MCAPHDTLHTILMYVLWFYAGTIGGILALAFFQGAFRVKDEDVPHAVKQADQVAADA